MKPRIDKKIALTSNELKQEPDAGKKIKDVTLEDKGIDVDVTVDVVNVIKSVDKPVLGESIKAKPGLGFNVGEKATYAVKLWKMVNGLGTTKGSVTFEINRGMYNRKDCYIFTGTAVGHGFGYELKLVSESYVDSSSLLPLLTTNTQSGTENREKKLVFHNDNIEYMKMKHCLLGDTCQQPQHYLNENGVKAHCERCNVNQQHYTWLTRATHNNDKPIYDLLSALFIARNFELKLGVENLQMKIVDGRDTWTMRIEVTGEEVIETEAGIFNTVALQLSALPLNDHAKRQKVFKGLFGLKGDVRLWVEKETNLPIRISVNN